MKTTPISITELLQDLREIIKAHGTADLDERSFRQAREVSSIVKDWSADKSARYLAAELGSTLEILPCGDLRFTRIKADWGKGDPWKGVPLSHEEEPIWGMSLMISAASEPGGSNLVGIMNHLRPKVAPEPS